MTTRRSHLWRTVSGLTPALASLVADCQVDLLPRRYATPQVIHAAALTLPAVSGSRDADPGIVELRRAAQAVNEQRPGFEVRVQPLNPPTSAASEQTPGTGATVASQSLTAYLEAALRSGQSAVGTPPPDLVLLRSLGELPTLLGQRLLVPLTELQKTGLALKMDRFAPGAVEAATVAGKLAVLPLAGSPNVLMYDAALFEATGTGPPDERWTWTALVDAGRRLTRPETEGDAGQWGILAHSTPGLLLSLIWSHGGEVLSADGSRSLLGEPDARDGIRLWADLLLRYRIAPLPPRGQGVSLSVNPGAIRVNTFEPGQPGPETAVQRVAMLVTGSVLSFSTPWNARRTILAADLPTARRRSAYLSLEAALGVTATAPDRMLAGRAAVALSDRRLRSPVAPFAFPVRDTSPAGLRLVQPQLTDQDANVVSRAFAASRGLPSVAGLPGFLATKVMTPILYGRVPVDDAARDATAALNEILSVRS